MRNVIIFTMFFTTLHAGAKWDIDQPVDKIPKLSLHGNLMGYNFELGEAKFTETGLTLNSKTKYGDYWYTTSITMIGVSEAGYWEVIPSRSSLSNRTPILSISYFLKDHNGPQYLPISLTIHGEYTMKLIIDKLDNNNHKGALHLSVPDYRKSYLIGEFYISK